MELFHKLFIWNVTNRCMLNVHIERGRVPWPVLTFVIWFWKTVWCASGVIRLQDTINDKDRIAEPIYLMVSIVFHFILYQLIFSILVPGSWFWAGCDRGWVAKNCHGFGVTKIVHTGWTRYLCQFLQLNPGPSWFRTGTQPRWIICYRFFWIFWDLY